RAGVRALPGLHRALDRRALRRADLVAGVLQHPLRAVHGLIRLVAELDLVLALLVLAGVRLGLLHHAIDFVLAETARCRNRDLLFLAGAEILRLHIDDAVGVDVERDFDLRHAARRWRQPDEMEFAERPVVARQRALA